MPPAWLSVRARSDALGFSMPSDAETAALLAMLAASKPGGRMLELGTGTGLSAAALLHGMDTGARLISVDTDPEAQAVAREALTGDGRVRFVLGNGLDVIRAQPPGSFDLIFADAMPGKYEGVDEALALLAPGGLWIGDDMLPQPNWPEGHRARVDRLLDHLGGRTDLSVAQLAWGSGFVIAAKRGSAIDSPVPARIGDG